MDFDLGILNEWGVPGKAETGSTVDGAGGTQLSTTTLLRTQGWSPLLKCHLAISGENLDAEHRGRSC